MIDFSQVTDMMLGNTPVEQVSDSQGNVLWSAAPVVLPNYFYVEDISGADNTLSIQKNNADAPTIDVFYSTDKSNWSSMGTTSTTAITATIPANGKLYLKCNTSIWASSDSIYNYIRVSGNHNIGGNIMSLIYGDNFCEQNSFPTGSIYNFSSLFHQNTTLVSAEDLILPATTLTEHCYVSMFRGCTALTTAPALPATTLAINCYDGMFVSCTALTTAPALPATTLADYCCAVMFHSCTNLNSVTTYAQDISASGCLSNWLYNVAATGDFYNLGGATYTRNASGIPTGWTIHTSL